MSKCTALSALAVLVFFTGSLIWWHRIDTRPPAWDESVHLHLALDYRDFLFRGTPITTYWADEYPPIYHLSLIPSLSFGIPTAARTVPIHAIYFALLMAGLVLLARSAGLSAEAAAWASLLFASYAMVFWVARRPMMEIAVASWVTLGMAFLWRADGFRSRRGAVMWGAISGIGLLIKPFYGFFLVVPCLYLLSLNGSEARGARIKNFLLGCGMAALVALPWYGWEGACFLRHAAYLAGERGAIEGDPSFTSLAGWGYYVQSLWPQMGREAFWLTLGGLALLAVPKRSLSRKVLGFLAAWAFSGYLFMTLIHNKDLRYTLALLPALALLSAAGWFALFENRIARSVLWLLAAYFFIMTCQKFDPPIKEDWKHLAIGEQIEKAHDPEQPLVLVSVLSNHPEFFPRGLRWSMRAQGWPMETSSPSDPTADFTEFIVRKSGDMGPDSGDLMKEWTRLTASGPAFEKLFQPIGRFPLQDGSEAVLYRRDPAVVFPVGPMARTVLERRLLEIVHRDIQGPVTVSITQGAAGEWRRGRFGEILIDGRSCRVRGLPVDRLHVRASGLWLNLYRVWNEKKLGLLAFSALEPSVEIRAAEIEALLRQRARGIDDIHVHFEHGFLTAAARWNHIRLKARGHVEIIPGRDLIGVIDSVSIGPVWIPGWIFGKIHRYPVPLYPIPPFPGKILVHSVRMDQDVLTVS